MNFAGAATTSADDVKLFVKALQNQIDELNHRVQELCLVTDDLRKICIANGRGERPALRPSAAAS